MDIIAALLLGILAGSALALPLGAIGVLLVQEGIARGWCRGLPSAGAVATVDTIYCALAVLIGSIAAPIITGSAPWPAIIGGGMLSGLGLRGALKALRPTGGTNSAGVATHGSSWRRYALFLGLTAINPATLLYFTALLPGLIESGPSPTAPVAFIIGVSAASFTWQALLVGLGASLRRKVSDSARRWTTVAGNTTVMILGIALTVTAF